MNRNKKFLIKQKSLPLPRIGGRVVSLTLEKRALSLASGLVFLLIALYLYFMSFSVFHVVEREQFFAETDGLAEEVARLERQYLSLAHSVNEPYARKAGFVPATRKHFVERGTLSIAPDSQ
jgi:hypothetical protein